MTESSTIGFHIYKDKFDTLSDSIEYKLNAYPEMKCFQIFTHGPRSMNENKINRKILKKFSKNNNIYVHSTYLSTFKKAGHINSQLQACLDIGAKGLVIHLQKVVPSKIVEFCQQFDLNEKFKGVQMILEMKAVKSDPTKSYETPEKINNLIEALKDAKFTPEQTAICIDTAHIYASGADIKSAESARDYLSKLKYPEYLTILHLNGNQYDNKKRAGDKHAVPFSDVDLLWGDKLDIKDSGLLEFVKWYLKNGKDIILELKTNLGLEKIKKGYETILEATLKTI